jgi:hypothetical protein
MWALFTTEVKMATIVVNIRLEGYDYFIGRTSHGYHYGNPFHIGRDGNRREVIDKFKRWLDGDPEFAHIEPDRRLWVLENMHAMKDSRIGCFCKPKDCHGDIYVEKLD